MFGIIAVALVAGLVANRWWVARSGSDDEGLDLKDVIGPVSTLAVVLLAFVVVEAISSYGRAREDIGLEARALDAFGEAALRVEDAADSRELQADAICYSRAVRFKEWDTMADGERAPEVSVWTGAMQDELAAMRRAGGDDELDRLLDIDAARAEARLARITESNPTIPDGLFVLMFVAVAVSVAGLAVFMGRGTNRWIDVGALVVATALLAGTLFMITDLDRPFGGVNVLEPVELTRITGGLEEDFAEFAPDAQLPCDAEGVAI
jgi:hypothetical protein